MAKKIWADLSSNRYLTSCPNLRVFFAPMQGGILWSAFYSCATSWPEHEPCRGLPPTKSLPLLYTLLLSAPRSYSSAHLSSSLSCGLFCRCSLKTGMPRLSCWILHAYSCMKPWLCGIYTPTSHSCLPSPVPRSHRQQHNFPRLQWLRRDGQVPLGSSCLS